jgi:hypothetical protein
MEQYKTVAKVAAVLFSAGLLIAPLDLSIQRDYKTLRFGGTGMSLPLREQMGQGMAIAFLGGFRGLVADLLWIKMHTEWEENRWERIPPLGEAVTSLQPQVVLFWDLLAWHFAYNFYHRAFHDRDEPNPLVRRHNARQWMLRGEKTMLEGIQNNPNDATLYASLARLYDDRGKFNDPAKAAVYWELCLDKEDAPTYAHRMAGHALHRAAIQTGDPAMFRKAFDWWTNIWLGRRDNPTEMWRTIRREVILMREFARHFNALTPEEERTLALKEASLLLLPPEYVFQERLQPMTPAEWRELFQWWSVEWVQPHSDQPQLWEFIRAKVVDLRQRATITPDEEDWLAQLEERLNIPEHDRIFTRQSPPPAPPAPPES